MRADDKSDDAELIRRILDDDQDAFSALCARYKPRLHSYLFLNFIHNHEDAEEIVQDTFLKVRENLETLKVPEKLLGWMRSIARQRYFAWRRKHGRRLEYISFDDSIQRQELHEEASLTAYRVSQQQAVEDELLEIVSRAIDKLPDLDRKVMRCADSGMSYQQIADELGLKVGAVKHRLYRARRKVKELVDGMVED